MANIRKSDYQSYNRMATATNDINRLVAQFQAHAQFLTRVHDVEQLEQVATKFASFLDEIKSQYVNTLKDNDYE